MARWPVDSKDVSVWHEWFAWHKVICEDQYVWLEYIERRWVLSTYDSDWEYRFPAGPDYRYPVMGISGNPA